MKEHFLLVLENGTVHVPRGILMFLGDFAFSFLQNDTVKCLDKEDSDRQGHSKYISIGKMS